MGSRQGAIDRALAFFDDGGFETRLAELVAIRSTSQDPAHRDELDRYLHEGIQPLLEKLGFTWSIHENPVAGSGPILLAERIEGEGPTVITYGHGDTVRGLEDQWRAGLDPWKLTREGDRWYGRGSADNKGQHAINLSAMEAVIAERGKLGFNVKLIIETGEESGSKGLSEIVAANKQKLAAEILLASDGPRAGAAVPTLSIGTRGSFNFDLRVDLRPGGVHSGNWGGMTKDPAIILSHAIASIADRNGRILVRDWVPAGVSNSVRALLQECELESDPEAATIDPTWGEPGLSAAEKVYAWTSFIVLAMLSGRPENPVNAVAPNAVAHCQLRYTVDVDPYTFEAALLRHLQTAGFPEVQVKAHGIRMPARRSDVDNPWVAWAARSMQKTLGKRVQIIPNSGGGLPNDVFMDHLGVQLLWVPHSYNGCKQHGPDEHLLIAPAREGIAAFAGLWWDMGEDGVPGGRDRD